MTITLCGTITDMITDDNPNNPHQGSNLPNLLTKMLCLLDKIHVLWSMMLALKTECRHDTNFVVTGGIVYRSSLRQHPVLSMTTKRWHHNDYRFSVWDTTHNGLKMVTENAGHGTYLATRHQSCCPVWRSTLSGQSIPGCCNIMTSDRHTLANVSIVCMELSDNPYSELISPLTLVVLHVRASLRPRPCILFTCFASFRRNWVVIPDVRYDVYSVTQLHID